MMVQAFFAMTPYYGQEIGLSTGQTAQFMSITTLVALVAQWTLGRISDRLDRRKVILFMALVMAISGGVISMVARIDYLFLLLMACLHTAMLHTLYSLSLAHTNDWLEPEEVIQANAKLLIWYGIGSIVGPFSASLAMQFFGPDGLWMFLGCVSLLLAGFILTRLRGRRSWAPEVAQEPWMPTAPMETSHYVELDPRYEPHQFELEFGAEHGHH